MMKRMVSLLTILALLLCHVPAMADGAAIKADWMPQETRQFFSASAFNGYTIGERASYLIENTVGGSYFFAVAQKDGYNALYGFREVNGAYQYWLKTDAAIPQGRGTFELWFNSGEVNLASAGTVQIGESLGIVFTRPDDDQADTALYFAVNKNGQFNVKVVCFHHVWDEAIVSSNAITYYLDEGSTVRTVYGVVETNLRYFSLDAFPKSLEAARESLSNPPAIPGGELSAQRIRFTGGQKFEVYSGPGAEYERGANGKASVSTNDWIQVFGSENGYIMIQYDLSSTKMRIGWITQTALPRDAAVDTLRFEYADAEIIAATFLTDDPLGSQTRLRTLSAGQSGVKWLAAMGSWVYVEITGSGLPVRGFVPASAIRKEAGSAAVTRTGSYTGADYRATAEALVYGSIADITVSVRGPSSWYYQKDADVITGYQLYANNVPLAAQTDEYGAYASSAWYGGFTLQSTLPAGTSVLGLCPIRKVSGQRADEMILISLSGK